MEHNIIFFIAVGFIAQTIDGAMGMAYGVSANTILLSIGVSPAAASASLHLAEIFTTAVSGISHIKLGNVSKSLIKKLLIPGILGGVLVPRFINTLAFERRCIHSCCVPLPATYSASTPQSRALLARRTDALDT